MLHLCGACDRHVRIGDECPFCGSSLVRNVPGPIGDRRLPRAALFTLALSATAAACTEGPFAFVHLYGDPGAYVVYPDAAAAPLLLDAFVLPDVAEPNLDATSDAEASDAGDESDAPDAMFGEADGSDDGG